MGAFEEALKLEEPPEPKTKRHEVLVGMSATVDPAGEAASVTLAYSNMQPFRLYLPLLQAASLLHELRRMTGQMIDRQHLALDRGANRLLEICDAAPRPANVQVMVDPLTHDRLFLFQFEHDPPVALRLSYDELPVMLAAVARAVARASH